MVGFRASTLFLMAWVGLGIETESRADEVKQPELAIEVHLHDYAGVPDWLRRRMFAVADEVYRPANIAVNWLDCTPVLEGLPGPPGCEGDVRATLLVVQFLPERMARGTPVRPTVFGYAPLGTPEQLPNRAVLFWDRIRDYSLAFAVDSGALLGAALAHEIGHLLLGPDKHRPGGIMRCPWQKRDITNASRGRLRFSPDEVVLVREGALRRALADRMAADGQ